MLKTFGNQNVENICFPYEMMAHTLHIQHDNDNVELLRVKFGIRCKDNWFKSFKLKLWRMKFI